MDRFYPAEDIPEMTGFSVEIVTEAIRSNEIESINLGPHTLRYSESSIRKWAESTKNTSNDIKGVTAKDVAEKLRDYGKRIYSRETLQRKYSILQQSDYEFFRRYSESALVDLVCRNIEQIEPDMKVVQKEYRLSYGNAVDILAKDQHGIKCLIEVKKNPSDIRLVAQCIDYPADFSERVRMITVSPHYPERILRHLRQLGYVEMYQFGFNKPTGKKKKSDLYLSLLEAGYLLKLDEGDEEND